MPVLTVVGASLVVVVVVLVFLVAFSNRRSGGLAGNESLSPVGAMALKGARHRGLLCVGLALTMLVAGVVWDAAAPRLLGLPLALAPGLAAAGALLGYAILPAQVGTARGPVSASLVPRTAWTYGSRRAFAVPGALTLATLGFLAWAGVVADPDDQGRMRSIGFIDGPVTSTASPFPGSFYGLPLALVTVLLAVATYVALRRISSTPTLPTGLDAAADRRWRTASTSLVSWVASAALLGYLGGAAFCAGLTVRSAASTIALNGGHTAGVVPAGTALALVGAALVLAGLVVASLAVRQAATLRSPAVPDPAADLVAPVRR